MQEDFTMDRTEKARELFGTDYFATETTGIVIEKAETNYARCSFRIEKKHLNANHCVMGGALFTLADFTAAVAANGDDMATVTLDSQIHYIRPAKGTYLVAETRCIKSGQKTCVFEVTITDDNDKTVAIATCTGIHL